MLSIMIKKITVGVLELALTRVSTTKSKLAFYMNLKAMIKKTSIMEPIMPSMSGMN